MTKRPYRTKSWKRRLKKHGTYLRSYLFTIKKIFAAVVIIGLSSLILVTMQGSQQIHATELLDTIARAESKGNYNAYFGNPTNAKIQFTSMTIDEVLLWQQQFVDQGSSSSAVGRYQFIDTTLRGLISELEIDGEEVFNQEMQDRLAVALLERRGVQEYVAETMTKEEFAYSLSKEWAALPKATGKNPEQSYYAGDGLNQALVSVHEIYASIDSVREL